MKRKVVAGLGNPGADYAETYHNAGALAVGRFAETAVAVGGAAAAWKSRRGLFEYFLTPDAAFVRPLVFMNESGPVVKDALKKFGAEPKDLILIHDDSDLPLGAYKISSNRGAAGHKGVQSVMDALRVKEFVRIRIGVRNPKERVRKKASDFVLKKMNARESAALAAVFDEIAELLFKEE